jgi:hypothetical protein
MEDTGRHVAFAQLGQVEATAEMLALAVEDNSFDAVGHGGEEPFETGDGVVIERVALVCTGEAQKADVAAGFEVEWRECGHGVGIGGWRPVKGSDTLISRLEHQYSQERFPFGIHRVLEAGQRILRRADSSDHVRGLVALQRVVIGRETLFLQINDDF